MSKTNTSAPAPLSVLLRALGYDPDWERPQDKYMKLILLAGLALAGVLAALNHVSLASCLLIALLLCVKRGLVRCLIAAAILISGFFFPLPGLGETAIFGIIAFISILRFTILFPAVTFQQIVAKQIVLNPDRPIATIAREQYYAITGDEDPARMKGSKSLTKIFSVASICICLFGCNAALPAAPAAASASGTNYTVEEHSLVEVEFIDGQNEIILDEIDGGWQVVSWHPGSDGVTDIVIGDSWQGIPVISIGKDAFNNTHVTSIYISDTVREIEAFAFFGCTALEEVRLPEALQEIHLGAFQSCSSLKHIELPSGLTQLHAQAFCRSGLTDITIPDNIVRLGAAVFEGCTSLQKVDLPLRMDDISANCFKDCIRLTSIRFPEGVEKVHSYCFAGSGLREIIIPEGVVKVSSHAFFECPNLETVSCPSTLQEIGSSAFRSNPNLRDVDLYTCTSVNERAFKESPNVIKHTHDMPRG